MIEGGGTQFPLADLVTTNLAIAANQDKIKLSLSPLLPYKLVFAYMEAQLSAAGTFYVEGELVFKQKGRPIARFPLSIGSDPSNTLLARSIVALCTATASPGPNTIKVVLSNTLTGGADTVALNGQDIFAPADLVTFDLKDVKNGTATVQALRVFVLIKESAQKL